ncbi:class B sortase [Proteiniclasticum sp. C24MP]|uniref:class B sortase n=1 Tax=Proteiniclasticum sp. C24MP TaxID=3374101 RepID=UPI0037540808
MIITKRNIIVSLLAIAALLQFSLWLYEINSNRAMTESESYYNELSQLNSSTESDSSAKPDVKLEVVPEELPPSFPVGNFTYTQNPDSALLKINPDYVGWIKIDNTKVDYPIVRGADNDEYLDINFKKEPDVLGSIFMDYRNIGMGLDRHTIIYGHYTERGYMFGDLNKYLDQDFLAENDTFTISTPQGEKNYQIFSIHISPSEGPFLDTQFKDTTYTDFLNMLNNESIMDTETALNKELDLLSLVTCNYAVEDGRLFIHAIEIEQ